MTYDTFRYAARLGVGPTSEAPRFRGGSLLYSYLMCPAVCLLAVACARPPPAVPRAVSGSTTQDEVFWSDAVDLRSFRLSLRWLLCRQPGVVHKVRSECWSNERYRLRQRRLKLYRYPRISPRRSRCRRYACVHPRDHTGSTMHCKSPVHGAWCSSGGVRQQLVD